MLNRINNLILDFVNPNTCEVCDKPLNQNNLSIIEFLCINCYSKISYAPNGETIINIISNNFENNDFYIDFAHCFIDVRKNIDYLKIIHSLKYYNVKNIAKVFGAELSNLIKKSGLSYDYIIPVPIHKAKLRERSYNQSFLIGKAIEENLNIKLIDNLIIKNKYTTSQTLLDHNQRLNNINKAYSINALNIEIENKSFLIVDDVLTTGSTINHIAKILKEGYANRTDLATLAFA